MECRLKALGDLLPKTNFLHGVTSCRHVTLKFPENGDPHSRAHLLRLINGARTSIDVEMYVLTQCGLVSALTRQHQRCHTAAVAVDWRMRTAARYYLGELVLAGITVNVK